MSKKRFARMPMTLFFNSLPLVPCHLPLATWHFLYAHLGHHSSAVGTFNWAARKETTAINVAVIVKTTMIVPSARRVKGELT